ncbi:MAG: hypothetical protein AAGB29_14865 [Planctomycetota bacterium]
MTRPRRASRAWGWAASAAVGVLGIAAVAMQSGCEGVAAAAVLFRDTDVKAVYTLPDRSMAVLVDDPKNQLRDVNGPGRVMANITYHLHQNRKRAGLSESTEIFGVSDIRVLQREVGSEAFAEMPIDEIGRRLGADMVLYAEVLSAGARVAGGLYRPNAVVDVKLINSADGSRIWPNPGNDLSGPGPGYVVTVEEEHEASAISNRSVEYEMMRRLAEEIGKEIAQLFYKHRGKEPGDMLPG